VFVFVCVCVCALLMGDTANTAHMEEEVADDEACPRECMFIHIVLHIYIYMVLCIYVNI